MRRIAQNLHKKCAGQADAPICTLLDSAHREESNGTKFDPIRMRNWQENRKNPKKLLQFWIWRSRYCNEFSAGPKSPPAPDSLGKRSKIRWDRILNFAFDCEKNRFFLNRYLCTRFGYVARASTGSFEFDQF